MTRVDQLLAGVAVGDATSNAALLMRDRLRALGYASDLYAPTEHIMPALRTECRAITDYAPTRGDTALHHFGLTSDVTDLFLASPARKILIYHNITPAHFFHGYSDALSVALDQSRRELVDIARACDRVWADSAYNAEELRGLGIEPVEVFPLPFDPAVTEIAPDPALLARLKAPLTTWLTVGRLAPNKRLEQAIRAFAHYRREHNPYSRLFIVGSHRSAPKYFTYLRSLVRELGVQNVCFEGYVWPESLAAYYRLADLFLSASDHEGYCLPLVEAMCHNVPVIAKRTGGVPEAMGSGGVLYEGLTARELAALAHAVQSDSALHADVLNSQARRVQELRDRDLSGELKRVIA